MACSASDRTDHHPDRAPQRDPSGVVGSRGGIPGAGRGGGFPGRARRADGAAGGRVRLAAHPDVQRRQCQLDPLRADGALRRRADRPIRHPSGDQRRPGPGLRRQWADDLRHPGLAADADLGTADRPRHRLHGHGVRRHRGQSLVLRATWIGHRHPDCCGGRRAARLSAVDGPTGRLLVLARGIPRGLYRRDRRRAVRDPRAARPSGGPRRTRLWRTGRPARSAPAQPLGRRPPRGHRSAACRSYPDLLGPGRRLRHLRRDHQRPGRHPLHPVGP